MSLNNIELQIISKYLDFKDITNLLKLNNDLKYNYHSTFDLIVISKNIIISKYYINKIVNILKNIFPNLEEIILNYKYVQIYKEEQIEKILKNYLNFKTISKLNVKINFIEHIELSYKFINDIDKLYKNGIIKNNNLNNIYIYHPYNECEDIFKYNNYKHVIGGLFNYLKLKEYQQYDNIYLRLYNNHYLHLKDIDLDNNIYIINNKYRFNNYELISCVEDFKVLYNISRLKHKINTEELKNFEINYYCNIVKIDFEELKNTLNGKYYPYVVDLIEIYGDLSECCVHSIKFNDEIFCVSDKQLIYNIDNKKYMYKDKEQKVFMFEYNIDYDYDDFYNYYDKKLYSLFKEIKHNFKLINLFK